MSTKFQPRINLISTKVEMSLKFWCCFNNFNQISTHFNLISSKVEIGWNEIEILTLFQWLNSCPAQSPDDFPPLQENEWYRYTASYRYTDEIWLSFHSVFQFTKWVDIVLRRVLFVSQIPVVLWRVTSVQWTSVVIWTSVPGFTNGSNTLSFTLSRGTLSTLAVSIV